MRILVGLAAMTTLVGCGDSRAVKTCEQSLVSQLKAPASFRRANVEQYGDKTDGWETVVIRYDSHNEIGANLRSAHQCVFPKKAGQIDYKDFKSFDMTAVLRGT